MIVEVRYPAPLKWIFVCLILLDLDLLPVRTSPATCKTQFPPRSSSLTLICHPALPTWGLNVNINLKILVALIKLIRLIWQVSISLTPLLWILTGKEMGCPPSLRGFCCTLLCPWSPLRPLLCTCLLVGSFSKWKKKKVICIFLKVKLISESTFESPTKIQNKFGVCVSADEHQCRTRNYVLEIFWWAEIFSMYVSVGLCLTNWLSVKPCSGRY